MWPTIEIENQGNPVGGRGPMCGFFAAPTMPPLLGERNEPPQAKFSIFIPQLSLHATVQQNEDLSTVLFATRDQRQRTQSLDSSNTV
jgi:hypothetical protein